MPEASASPHALDHTWQQWEGWLTRSRQHAHSDVPTLLTSHDSLARKRNDGEDTKGAKTPFSCSVSDWTARGRSKPADRCTVSFRLAIIGAITIAVLLACACMYIPLGVLIRATRNRLLPNVQQAVDRQNGFIKNMTLSETTTSGYTNLLNTLSSSVRQFVAIPPQEALDNLWVTFLGLQRFSPGWDGRTVEHQALIAYETWQALESQVVFEQQISLVVGSKVRNVFRRPHADWLYVAFWTGELAGVKYGLQDLVPYAIHVETSNLTEMFLYEIDTSSGAYRMPPQTVSYNTTTRPFYTVQAKLLEQAKRSPGGAGSQKAQRAWSQLYPFVDGDVGLSWTAPLAYCGNYSCFQGVVAADMTLRYMSSDCLGQFQVLQQVLSEHYNFNIGPDNSSVFIVNQGTNTLVDESVRYPGKLIASSHPDAAMSFAHLEDATATNRDVVRLAAMAILHKYGSWDSKELITTEKLFAFRKPNMRKSPPEFVECDPIHLPYSEWTTECQFVGTLSVALDNYTRFLVVASMPLGAFSSTAKAMAELIDDTVSQNFRIIMHISEESRLLSLGVFICIALFSVALGGFIGMAVSKPLEELSLQMCKLRDLDFQAVVNGSSCISDVNRLQDSFSMLSKGMGTFARFVPEMVVKNIISGDARATRLHVTRREVTIMFSDIRDFTTIAESLSQKDLLFVLTHYLSVMTRIIELFDGVVAEILGDGVLAYWNTPALVEDHAAKACAAALAQQQALEILNHELSHMELPQLALRIGLHTGVALTGNIGSDKKMKFGCIGDPVNLASRLEGLCKKYTVGIICSASTIEHLKPTAGFVHRRLDLVQVKGKTEPITIYEMVGRGHSAEGAMSLNRANTKSLVREASSAISASHRHVAWNPFGVFFGGKAVEEKDEVCQVGDVEAPQHSLDVSAEDMVKLQLYEEALKCFQEGRFHEAQGYLQQLLEHHEDSPARLLLERIDGLGPNLDLQDWTGVNLMTDKFS